MEDGSKLNDINDGGSRLPSTYREYGPIEDAFEPNNMDCGESSLSSAHQELQQIEKDVSAVGYKLACDLVTKLQQHDIMDPEFIAEADEKGQLAISWPLSGLYIDIIPTTVKCIVYDPRGGNKSIEVSEEELFNVAGKILGRYRQSWKKAS